MTVFSFADRYRAAGLAPGPEIIKLRQAPFDRIRENLVRERVVHLTRLYFGIPAQITDESSWFSSEFAQEDPSFTLLDNKREAAVLASCVLSAALETDLVVPTGLSLLCASAGGNRTPEVQPDLVTQAARAIRNVATESTRAQTVEPAKHGSRPKTFAAEIDAMIAAGPDFPKLGELLKQYSAGQGNMAVSLSSEIEKLQRQGRRLETGLELLWWYVGGWSRVFDRPFSTFELPAAALLSAWDFADLTLEPPGPVAAQAVLYRLISAGRKAAPAEKIAITDVVDSMSSTELGELKIETRSGFVVDLCPVLTALQKASQIGGGTAWHSAFRKTAQLDETVAFLPQELALHVYRELMLTRSLSGE